MFGTWLKRRKALHSPSVFESPVQEGVSKGIQVAEGLFGVHREGIAGDDTFCVSIHEGSETVSGWLWSNPASREVLFNQIPEDTVSPSSTSSTSSTSSIYKHNVKHGCTFVKNLT